MSRLYSLDEAQALLPEARHRIAEVAGLVDELRWLVEQLQAGTEPGRTMEDVAMLEAAVDAAFSWFEANDVQVKGLSPALLDFPARAVRDGEHLEVLLCWRDDEETIAYYHPSLTGYRTREPVALLDRV